MQGVLLVDESIVVAYDYKRGEPRGKIKKTASPMQTIQAAVSSQGDCIDCNLCVAVCPTGIDIRNGTQLECTNCTACMDACDGIMEKVGRPKELIRYDSKTGIESGNRKIFTTRVWAYTAVLVALVAIDGVLLYNRGAVETIIQRARGQTFQKVGENEISNLYTFSLINKTGAKLPVDLHLVDLPEGKLTFAGAAPDTLPKGGVIQGAFNLVLPKNKLNGRKTEVHFEVTSNGEQVDFIESNFLGPF